MWLPKTEAEIVNVINSGILEESDAFDAKEELSKNQEIAKDVAAMANNGGVIIYGIGEDERGRVTRLTPIPIQGVAERIDAIVRSSITEPPIIHTTTIPTEADPTIGYLVVFVPPSERAPHMVVVKGDHRYYGRTATGNYLLPEGEVARLYARRQQSEINREKLLEEEISRSPLEPNKSFGYLFIYARPVFARDDFFHFDRNGDTNLQTVLNQLVQEVSSGTIYRRNYEPDFNPPGMWKYRAEGLFGQLSYPPGEIAEAPRYTLNLQVDFNGGAHLFCGRAADRYMQEALLVFHDIPTGLTVRFLALLGRLYERTKYYGMVDLGLAITGIMGSVLFSKDIRFQYMRSSYEYDTYKKTGRFSALQMKEDPYTPTKALLMPFIDSISQGRIDLFQQK